MSAHDISKELPVIDLDVFLAGNRDSEAVIRECKKVLYIQSGMDRKAYSISLKSGS